MAQEQDALAFIEEIRVAEFWRKQFGEFEYSQRDPDDLFRWYKAMELRGPQEIRAYVEERVGRYPSLPVTGIVSTAPHPSREVIDLWLATHDKTRTGSYWVAGVAFLLACLVVMPNLNGCQGLKNPNATMAWLPQPATLVTGQMNGAPQSAATMPSHGPAPPVSIAQPTAAAIALQNGNSVPRSAPLGAEIGTSSLLSNAASSSVSSSSTSNSTPGSAAFTSFQAQQQQGGAQAASSGSSSQHH